MRRITCLLTCLFCFLYIEAPLVYAQEPQNLAASAQAAILMDADTGRVLFAKNADKEMKIASLTKIMTAIIAIEQGKLDDLVEIKPSAVGVEGSSIYLKAGEKIPLETLLYGLMLRSGNDAAVAIAEHIGGSVEGFVYLMNEKAMYLGLQHTHFANPHGLDVPDHYSSARDLALLTQYALKNPTFQKIISTQVKTVPWPGEKWYRKFYNKNKILKLYKWANGVKTGYTKQAKRTLVSSAMRDGLKLIAVTLNDGNDWQDHIDLFEYGFRNYKKVPVVEEGEVIQKTDIRINDDETLMITAGRTVSLPLTEEERKNVQIEPIITFPLSQVKESGVEVGSARVIVNGEVLATVPLVSSLQKEKNVLDQWLEVLFSVWGQVIPQ
jgi:D-alanyl-D-alanine carboxypeptidase